VTKALMSGLGRWSCFCCRQDPMFFWIRRDIIEFVIQYVALNHSALLKWVASRVTSTRLLQNHYLRSSFHHQLQLQSFIETAGGDARGNASFVHVAQMIVPCVSSASSDDCGYALIACCILWQHLLTWTLQA
jgi:hypothetical protein